MVDVGVLSSDVLQLSIFLVTPALVWLFLYYFAWLEPTRARAAGFDRLTFWLLLPAALIGSLTNAPIFSWAGDVLAVNVGGGVIPAFLAAFVLYRTAPEKPTVGLFGAVLTLETIALLAVVLFAPSGPWTIGLVFGGATAFVAGVGYFGASGGVDREGGRREVSLLLGLTSAMIVGTFVTTQAIVGLGIVSSFPWYLLAPAALGGVSVLFVRTARLGREVRALPIAYATSTLGVLIGADVLHQVPLYGHGPAIFSIGGAGLFDLVYLTGLISLGAAYLTGRAIAGTQSPLGAGADSVEITPPARELRQAAELLSAGQGIPAVRKALQSVDHAFDDLRHLRGTAPPAPDSGPEPDPSLPLWVHADIRNLQSLADRGVPDLREATRALATARLLVNAVAEAARRSYGSLSARVGAFALDLVIVTAPALAVWAALAVTLPGSATDILGGVAYNVAVFAYPAYAFAFLVLSERITGTTFGKGRAHLAVRTRRLGIPPVRSTLVRNAPKLVPLNLIALAVAPALVLLGHPGTEVTGGGASISDAALGILLIGVAGVGLLVCAGVSAALILVGSERQRLGDLWAGTWVVRTVPTERSSAFPTGRSQEPARAQGPSG